MTVGPRAPPDRGQRPAHRAGRPRRRLRRAHRPTSSPASLGETQPHACFHEDPDVETRLLIREPAWWLAAILLPSVILLDPRRRVRAAPARSGPRRPALHRPVRPVAASSSPSRRSASTRCRSASPTTARRASCAGSRRRRSTRAMLLLAQLVDLHRRRRSSPCPARSWSASSRSRSRCRRTCPASSSRSCSGCRRCSHSACSSLPSCPRRVRPTHSACPLFFAVMFLGGVYLPRWLLPDILVSSATFTPPGRRGRCRTPGSARRSTPLPLVVMAGHDGRHRRRRRARTSAGNDRTSVR